MKNNVIKLICEFCELLWLASLAILLLSSITGCASTRHPIAKPPEVVKVVVEQYRPLPAWATQPLNIPEPADNTVGERIKAAAKRKAVLQLANCHRALLAAIDADQTPEYVECEVSDGSE